MACALCAPAQDADGALHILPAILSGLLTGGTLSPLSQVRCRSARHPLNSTQQEAHSQLQLKKVIESCRHLKLTYFADIL